MCIRDRCWQFRKYKKRLSGIVAKNKEHFFRNKKIGGIEMNLDKMSMEEIKKYVKELEDFKEKVSSYSPEELRALKMLYAETRIKMLIGRFSDMIKID